MKIYLVRHGQNEDNKNGILNGHRDLPLTDLGYEQALNLAKHLKSENQKFDLVLSSPLMRAYDTAVKITNELNLADPVKENLLIERNFGVMSGEKIEDIPKLCGKNVFQTDTILYFLNPEGAETFPDLLVRAEKLLKKIELEYSDKNEILLVGHGDFGKMLYAKYYSLDWKYVLKNFHFGNSEMIVLDKNLAKNDRFYFKQIQHNH